MGESSGCGKGYIKMGTFGHLWCLGGHDKSWDLLGQQKQSREEISFLSYCSHPQHI